MNDHVPRLGQSAADPSFDFLTLGPVEVAALRTLVAKLEDNIRENALGPRPGASRDACRDLALKIFEARRVRSQFFDRELFSEPAWDMLLALYCMSTSGKRLTVSGLGHAAGYAVATAMRWQDRLIEAGMIVREPSAVDGRIIYVELSASGVKAIDNYLSRLLERRDQSERTLRVAAS